MKMLIFQIKLQLQAVVTKLSQHCVVFLDEKLPVRVHNDRIICVQETVDSARDEFSYTMCYLKVKQFIDKKKKKMKR